MWDHRARVLPNSTMAGRVDLLRNAVDLASSCAPPALARLLNVIATPEVLPCSTKPRQGSAGHCLAVTTGGELLTFGRCQPGAERTAIGTGIGKDASWAPSAKPRQREPSALLSSNNDRI